MKTTIPLINVQEQESEVPEPSTPYLLRGKIYVRRMKGFFQRIRSLSLSLLMAMYFLFVWIRVDGNPLVFFDLEVQKFYLFGAIFWPQDFTLLAFALIICAFGLFFITGLLGRIWCGYSCPQTAWSLMFIWLEEFFEGSRHQRIKLDQERNSLRKWLKKSGKHASWLILALATAITFVGYFYPIRTLTDELFSLSLESAWAMFWIAFFTLATYLNAGWLREKVCIYMCPYARFQSVMFNEKTLIIGYDNKRGEPRGRRSKHSDQSHLGDCIECQMCVQVCPTGIDIRDGLQYECIGCALCIDACDSIMTKMSTPTGLIRYASEKEFATGQPQRTLNIGTVGYGATLLIAICVFISVMVHRPQAELSVLRDRGSLYFENGLGQVENFYTLKLVNKRETEDTFRLSVKASFPVKISQENLSIGAGEVRTYTVILEVAPEQLSEASNPIEFISQSLTDPSLRTVSQSKFLGPVRSED
jgi:cytochrome c oxidase accessory protein FixG